MSDSQKEIVRRHFTLSKQLDARLNELAREHYEGNVSRLIRCAISDHERTLNDQDEFAIKSLESRVDTLGKELSDLNEGLEDKRTVAHHTSSPPEKNVVADSEKTDNDAKKQRKVHQVLLEEGPLNLEQLVERVDEDPLVVQKATESLIDREFVAKEPTEDQVKYQIHQ